MYTMVNAEIHSETYCQVRGRMLGPCDDAFDGTEELESTR